MGRRGLSRGARRPSTASWPWPCVANVEAHQREAHGASGDAVAQVQGPVASHRERLEAWTQKLVRADLDELTVLIVSVGGVELGCGVEVLEGKVRSQPAPLVQLEGVTEIDGKDDPDVQLVRVVLGSCKL